MRTVRVMCDELFHEGKIDRYKVPSAPGKFGAYYYGSKLNSAGAIVENTVINNEATDNIVIESDDIENVLSDNTVYKRPPDYIRDFDGNFIGIYRECLDYVIEHGESKSQDILNIISYDFIKDTNDSHKRVLSACDRLVDYGIFIKEKHTTKDISYKINEVGLDKFNLQVKTRRYIDKVSDTEINNAIYDLIKRHGQITVIDVLDELNVYREVQGKSHHEKGYKRVYNTISAKVRRGILESSKQENSRLATYKFA